MATPKSYGQATGRETPERKPKKAPANGTVEFRGYLNVNLTDDQKKAFVAWYEMGSFWNTLQYSLAAGVQLSVKQESDGQTILASATCRNPDSPNAGLCVTARAKEGGLAVGRLMFILDYLGIDAAWEKTVPLPTDDRW